MIRQRPQGTHRGLRDPPRSLAHLLLPLVGPAFPQSPLTSLKKNNPGTIGLLQKGLLLGLGAPWLVGWLANELQGSQPYPVMGSQMHMWYLHGCWESNSGPHTCLSSIYHSELSSGLPLKWKETMRHCSCDRVIFFLITKYLFWEVRRIGREGIQFRLDQNTLYAYRKSQTIKTKKRKTTHTVPGVC